MNLKNIFDNNGTDKSSKHKYHEIYEPLFAPKRNEEINFLEVGIWYGHGMQSFLDYFPNGQIYGIDIFSRMTPDDVPALKNDRAHYVIGDTTSWSTSSLLTREFGVEFDYILDDGAHTPEANMLTFRHCSKLLKPGGLYIIEDVWPLERMTAEELNHPWLKKHPERYGLLANELFLGELQRSNMKIERYDNRRISGHPDSYVITLRKE